MPVGFERQTMKLTLMAVAALALSAGAQADDTFDLGTVGGTVPIGNTVFAGSFVDTINFDLASLSTVTAIALNTSYLLDPPATTLGKISFFAASLDGVPLTLSIATTSLAPGLDVIVQKLFVNDALKVGGPHTLTIAGVADAFSSAYTGSISVTAVTSVPEPETYALMLAGLAAIGWLAKRRSA